MPLTSMVRHRYEIQTLATGFLRSDAHLQHMTAPARYARSLFDPTVVAELHQRMARLTPASRPEWGKMSVGQMLAHCAIVMTDAVGDTRPPRMLIGRIIGPFARGRLTSNEPIEHNAPTDRKRLIPTDDREVDAERARLLSLIDRFSAGGPQGVTTHPHSFFGPMTPEQWAIWMYKHIDHHLRQFGV